MNKGKQLLFLQTLQKLVPEATSFQRDQKAVIDRILAGRDVLAIMPTGGGKSVCYQVPAMHLPGITLVISPLVALMEDQVKKLQKIDEPGEYCVACLSSEFIADRDGFHYNKDKDEIERDENRKGGKNEKEAETASRRKLRNRIFLDAIRGKYKLLYVTPERLRNGAFIRFAQKANISMIAIDEAHCISLWGYKFRPSYLEISRLLTRIGYHPIIAAFTATATNEVRNDIIKLLGMRDPVEVECDSVSRGNLRFSICNIDKKYKNAIDESKPEDIYSFKYAELLQYVLEKHESSGIVYCSETSFVNAIYQYLKKHGIGVTRYYADLDKDLEKDPEKEEGESKQKNFDDFINGVKKVMVSTTALGMGVDKSDIRFVIHFNLPTCLENYYQEAGRAGRDGKEAECILYYLEGDIKICYNLIDKENKNSSSRLSEKDLAIRKKIDRKRLNKMIGYAKEGDAKSSGELQEQIIDYFDKFDPCKRDTLLRLLIQDNDLEERIKRIDVLYANRTKIAWDLRKGKTEGNVWVSRRGKKYPKLTATYKLTGGRLTYFDLMVADAVYTLMANRVPTIYARTVMELLSGNEDLMLQPERKKQVEDSILKMIRTNIEIDRSNSAEYGFAYGENKLKLNGAFLPLQVKKKRSCSDDLSDNNGCGFVYDDGAVPPLYEYAEILNGQFYSFPAKYLRVKKKVCKDGKIYVKDIPSSFENLTMIHYLLCRIDMMPFASYKQQKPDDSDDVVKQQEPDDLDDSAKRRERHSVASRTLRFDTMLRDTGINLPDEKGYRDRRIKTLWEEKLLPILEHFKSIGNITGYKADYGSKSVLIKR